MSPPPCPILISSLWRTDSKASSPWVKWSHTDTHTHPSSYPSRTPYWAEKNIKCQVWPWTAMQMNHRFSIKSYLWVYISKARSALHRHQVFPRVFWTICIPQPEKKTKEKINQSARTLVVWLLAQEEISKSTTLRLEDRMMSFHRKRGENRPLKITLAFLSIRIEHLFLLCLPQLHLWETPVLLTVPRTFYFQSH